MLLNRTTVALTALLGLQGISYYATAARPELTPNPPPLSAFPQRVGAWQSIQDAPLEPEVLDVLKADDTLNRVYAKPGVNAPAYFFIAFFKTQRTGSTPHSPKNCLPGSGWEPIEKPGLVSIDVPGRSTPLVANRYVVARGDDKSVTIYWYQSHDRVIASEFAAKFWLIADAIRYRRSDTALVKVVIPVTEGSAQTATDEGVQFVRAAYPAVAAQLPK
jgi:EpsI family protein